MTAEIDIWYRLIGKKIQPLTPIKKILGESVSVLAKKQTKQMERMSE